MRSHLVSGNNNNYRMITQLLVRKSEGGMDISIYLVTGIITKVVA